LYDMHAEHVVALFLIGTVAYSFARIRQDERLIEAAFARICGSARMASVCTRPGELRSRTGGRV